MATGRPPKPTEVKRRTGNPGKRPLPNVGALAIVPPIEQEPYERDPADTLAEVYEAGRTWLAATDATAVALLRQSLDERSQLRAAVMTGDDRWGTARKALRDLDKQIITLLSQLGFDPAARSRLGLAEVKARTTLEKLRGKD